MAKCKYCGKNIDPNAVFVVEGRYPFGRAVVWWRAKTLGWVSPETYGDIYHKECYFKHESTKGMHHEQT